MRGWNKHRYELAIWRAQQEAHFRRLGIIKTLDDMTEEEIRAIEEMYGCKVKRPKEDDDDPA